MTVDHETGAPLLSEVQLTKVHSADCVTAAAAVPETVKDKHTVTCLKDAVRIYIYS